MIGLFLLSAWLKSSKWKKSFFWAGVFLLVFFSNQYISNRVMLWWEYAPIPMEEVGNYDVAIVFSGVTKGSKAPRDRVYFGNGADRITHTLQLYNEGKVKNIIVSGGLGFQQVKNTAAADRLESFLTMAGVPDSVITKESDAANTYENAVNVAKILKEKFPDQKYLLITSAFHMTRSKLCLEKQGVDFDIFPAGFLTTRSTANFDDLFIPKSEAIGRWEQLIKEMVGIATYKLMGYI
ncbi:YdcF family protein [Roseivirga sp. E12]|uniref:YdcF family protein n=1 Tax=Roseivirga sp. E12 TaxID=2819237 RepID=UPI001ABD30B0|nr:YdcF family protein [Roseivirga sp. E12]